MSLVLLEGFDFYSSSFFAARGWSGSIDAMASPGRLGVGQAARCRNGDHGAIKVLPSTYTTIIVGAAVNPDGAFSIGAQRIFALASSTSDVAIAGIGIDSSGHVFVFTSSAGSGTTVATGSTVLTAGAWNYIELKIVIAGASGSYEVHLNGISELASTTYNFGTTPVGYLQIGSPFGNVPSTAFGGRYSHNIDDIYVCSSAGSVNNTFLGDTLVETLYPNADGAHTQWTPDTGTAHYSRVNETSPDGDTSYVADSTVNDRDSYAFANLATLLGNVYGVQTNMYAKKDSAGARQICAVTRPTSTDHDGATVTLTTSYVFFNEITEQNPDSSTAWTISAINASEWGVKVVT